jgi:hypothetical protein
MNPVTAIESAIKSGIPLKLVRFRNAVNNIDNEPQAQYSDASSNKARRANMWLTFMGFIFEQKGKYFGTPNENVIDWIAKD